MSIKGCKLVITRTFILTALTGSTQVPAPLRDREQNLPLQFLVRKLSFREEKVLLAEPGPPVPAPFFFAPLYFRMIPGWGCVAPPGGGENMNLRVAHKRFRYLFMVNKGERQGFVRKMVFSTEYED